MTTDPGEDTSELAAVPDEDDPDRQHVEVPDDDELEEGTHPYPQDETPQDFPDQEE